MPGAGSTHWAPRCNGADLKVLKSGVVVLKPNTHFNSIAAELTVEVLPLGRDELLGGGLAHGFGEALARDGVLGGENAVVYRLAARHVADRVWGQAAKGADSSSYFRCGGRISD